MYVVNSKLEDNDFVISSMKKMSKMFSRPCENKNSVKCDIRTDTKGYQKTMFMSMIYTPEASK